MRIDSNQTQTFLYLGVIMFSWLAVYLWDLGSTSLVYEEGRRALIAKNYTAFENWVVPELFGRDYLNKPPGFPTLIYLTSWFLGEVNEWSIRLPSAFAILTVAISLFYAFSNLLSIEVRFFAAMVCLTSFMSVEKGRLGEIEAVFMAVVWFSILAWWKGFQDNKLNWSLFSFFLLGCAILIKGPPALVFFYGAVVSYCVWRRQTRWLISLAHGLGILIVSLLVGFWLVPLFWLVDYQHLVETANREIVNRGSGSMTGFFIEQGRLLVNSLFGLFPGSLLCLSYSLSHPWGDDTARKNLQRFLLCLVCSSAVFFLAYPGAKARYLYPIAPALSLLGAMVLERVRGTSDQKILKFLQLYSIILLLLAFAAGVVGVVWGLRFPYKWMFLIVCGIGLWAGSVLAWFGSRRSEWGLRLPYQVGLLVLMAFFLSTAQDIQRETKYNIKPSVERLASMVPSDDLLYTLDWKEFNLFFYLNQPVRYIRSLSEIENPDRKQIVLYQIKRPDSFWDGWIVNDLKSVELINNQYIVVAVITRE